MSCLIIHPPPKKVKISYTPEVTTSHGETPEPTAVKFCMPGTVDGLILRANLGEDPSRGFGVARGRILVGCCIVTPTTLLHFGGSMCRLL